MFIRTCLDHLHSGELRSNYVGNQLNDASRAARCLGNAVRNGARVAQDCGSCDRHDRHALHDGPSPEDGPHSRSPLRPEEPPHRKKTDAEKYSR